jgi:hypothetical protein
MTAPLEYLYSEKAAHATAQRRNAIKTINDMNLGCHQTGEALDFCN